MDTFFSPIEYTHRKSIDSLSTMAKSFHVTPFGSSGNPWDRNGSILDLRPPSEPVLPSVQSAIIDRYSEQRQRPETAPVAGAVANSNPQPNHRHRHINHEGTKARRPSRRESLGVVLGVVVSLWLRRHPLKDSWPSPEGHMPPLNVPEVTMPRVGGQ
jgi:hypothetical protein